MKSSFIYLFLILFTIILVSCDMPAPTGEVESPAVQLAITLKNDDNKSVLNYSLKIISFEIVKDTRKDNATITSSELETITGSVPMKRPLGQKGEINIGYSLLAKNSYEDMDNGTAMIYKTTLTSFQLTLSKPTETQKVTYIGYPLELKPGTANRDYSLFYVMIPNSPAVQGISYLSPESAKCGYGHSRLKGFTKSLLAMHLVFDTATISSTKMTMGEGTVMSKVYWDSKANVCLQGL